MKKLTKKTYHALFLLIVLSLKATGRYLRDNDSELVSNGTDDSFPENRLPFLQIKRVDHSPEERCEQLYGFLPCSENLSGHLFLVVVYEYLLYNGESYVTSGGKRIFKILGPGIFGASAFHVLGFLPESLILLCMSHSYLLIHNCISVFFRFVISYV